MAMTWTTDTPTTPGWYWARWHFDEPPGTPEIVQLVMGKGFRDRQVTEELRVVTFSEGENADGELIWDRCQSQIEFSGFNDWCGPLEPPA